MWMPGAGGDAVTLDERLNDVHALLPELMPHNPVVARALEFPKDLKRSWDNGVVPSGCISGRQEFASSRAYVNAVRSKRRRDARRERFFVAAFGGLVGAVMALSGRWLLDRGVRRG